MCARLHLFLPVADLRAAVGPAPARAPARADAYVAPIAIVSFILGCMLTVHGRLDTAGSLYMLLSVLYLRVVLHRAPAAAAAADASRVGLLLTLVMSATAFAYGFLTPVIGVQSMASSNMYSNSVQYGRGNHFFSPTSCRSTTRPARRSSSASSGPTRARGRRSRRTWWTPSAAGSCAWTRRPRR